MLLALLWLPLLSVVCSSTPFQCYSCGVFLNAPTPACKGMLLALLWLPLLSVVCSSTPFQCYSCGVFLNAPTPACKGEPKKINCTNIHVPIGCVSVTALNRDGSYYVEKRCAYADEKKLKSGECIDVEMPKLKEARKCFCTKELCNAAGSLSTLICFLALLIFYSLNKPLT